MGGRNLWGRDLARPVSIVMRLWLTCEISSVACLEMASIAAFRVVLRRRLFSVVRSCAGETRLCLEPVSLGWPCSWHSVGSGLALSGRPLDPTGPPRPAGGGGGEPPSAGRRGGGFPVAPLQGAAGEGEVPPLYRESRGRARAPRAEGLSLFVWSGWPGATLLSGSWPTKGLAPASNMQRCVVRAVRSDASLPRCVVRLVRSDASFTQLADQGAGPCVQCAAVC